MADVRNVWEGFLPQNEDAVTARQLQEVDMYDVGGLSPQLSQPYQERLMRLSNVLDNQMDYSLPGAPEIRRRLLNNAAELIRGETNFSADPYAWYPSQAKIESIVPRTQLPKGHPDRISDKHEAVVDSNKRDPDQIWISPYNQSLSTSALLPHEGLHVAQVGRAAQIPWRPMFDIHFMRDLKKLSEEPKSPFYYKGSQSGSSFETDPYEVMSYLYGREAELPAGKTLKDDPALMGLFQKHPDAYNLYSIGKERLQKTFTKKKR